MQHAQSAARINSDLECSADLAHAFVAEATQALHKDSDRDALDSVEIYAGSSWDGVVARFQHNLAGQASDGCRAWGDECTAKPWNGDVTRQHHDGAASDARQLAPPELPS